MVLLQAPDLVKAYPPFVNFFENTKEMLVKCDQTKPRFHAFLKICQTKPECGRQSLQELLIRPVQRLPSISLLLSGKCYLEGQMIKKERFGGGEFTININSVIDK